MVISSQSSSPKSQLFCQHCTYNLIVMETCSKWYVNTEFIVMETPALTLRSIGVWYSAPSAKKCTIQVCLSVAVSINNCWQGNSIIWQQTWYVNVCYNSVIIFKGVSSCTLASTNPEGLKPMKLSGSPYKRYVHIRAVYHSVRKLAKFNLAIYENASLIFHTAYTAQPYIS